INSLKFLDKPIISSIITPGEQMKDLAEISHIIRPYFKTGLDRNSCLIAIGGGVTTDLGGFIASILLRGIPHINIPTTLLGMVDASIGGKTGVNFHLGKDQMLKNMLGTFKQPDLILSDTSLLKSLPEREIKSGLGEIVKYSIGWGRPPPRPLRMWNSLGTSGLETIISTCQKIKLDIIQKDPLDKLGLREKLNLGHTIGHAIEAAAAGRLSHGESVALGLVAAAKISYIKGLLQLQTKNQIIEKIQNLGFATTTSGLQKESILNALKFDKKAQKIVLIKDIGDIISQQKIETEIIRKVLDDIII
ncbi:3-dehydroquinate synthase, partial [Candidatus Gottesmanbacteria bacterium]|nr:3-dehydroquinate synthase [Candidatus Gottesmanbacteria bacterium]